MELDLQNYPIALEPSLWSVMLKAALPAKPEIAAELYQSRCVTYTRQEAIDIVLKQLKTEHLETFKRGNQMGGWRIGHVEQITIDGLEKMFKDCTDKAKKAFYSQHKLERNELLQEIITNRDIDLLHSAIKDGRITENERLYIHDKLAHD
jgi:hypothetical protein